MVAMKEVFLSLAASVLKIAILVTAILGAQSDARTSRVVKVDSEYAGLMAAEVLAELVPPE